MRLIEVYHNPALKIFQKPEISNPDNYKKHPHYKNIAKKMEIGIKRGYTFGPVIHYGDIKPDGSNFNKKHQLDHEITSTLGAPGGLYFSMAQNNFHKKLPVKSLYKNDPFSSHYFSSRFGTDGYGIVCMLKAKKICNLDRLQNIIDENGFFVDGKEHLLKRFIKGAFPSFKDSKKIEECFLVLKNFFSTPKLDDFGFEINDGSKVPSFLGGTWTELVDFCQNDDILAPRIRKDIVNAIDNDDMAKLEAIILSIYGYDPVIIDNDEIICYDLSCVFICGETSDNKTRHTYPHFKSDDKLMGTTFDDFDL